ncbi:SagB/ThcOx family dehydrogenase [Fontivita pretiosa]|uniref:SagB/ThcOx family dehydrogenase n=1 Tax=Fontivita pretiosa TaxID=2989684 RepID=UPI003D176767
MNTNLRLSALFVTLAAAAALLIASPAPAPPATTPASEPAQLEIIQLAPPLLDKGAPLMQALKQRRSIRNLDDRPLSHQQLSEILWAANGINRDDGKRTVPSALARYPIDVYAVLERGVYLYEPAGHRLLPVAAGDFRQHTGSQAYVHTAPLNLVYVVDLERLNGPGADPMDQSRLRIAGIEVGCMAQNVYLYCASEGLGTTLRTSIQDERFGPVIRARPTQRIIAAQAIGHPR